jgi:hypothetical protein
MGAAVVTPDKRGYGYACRYAIERARGEYVVISGADTTYDFQEIPTLLEPVMDGRADIAIGSRFEGEIVPGAMPALHRYVGNPLLTKLLNLFYEAGVSDAHSGFRVLSREAIEALDTRSDGMEFASEMIMQASAEGLRIAEVPITYHERNGDAKLETFSDGWRHVRFMLMNAPGYLFHGPGLVFGAVGLLLMALGSTGPPVAGQDFGIHSVIAGSLMTFVGFQLVSFGLLTLIGANPIRNHDDPLTRWLLAKYTLERGVAAGILLFLAGGTLATFLIVQWVQSGFNQLPDLTADIIAFTAIMLGIQTVFWSFFASIIADD